MSRKTNSYGVPIWNAQERALLNSILVSKPCKVCKVKKGDKCLFGRWDGKGIVYDDLTNTMKDGSVHMGRLPNGFDSVKAVNEAIEKLES
mgnify:CR=1 FL=1